MQGKNLEVKAVFTVSEKAVEKLKEMLAEKGQESYFRIFIDGFG